MSRILVISASQQKVSQSRKVSEVIRQKLDDAGVQADILDLGQTVLPLWSGDEPNDKAAMATVEAQLNSATGFVFVIPEWNGMAPPALKNLLIWFGAAQFAHKPALLCAVSAGMGGAFVISEMRGTSYKNSRICYLPEHLIIRDIEQVLQGTASAEHPSEPFYQERIDFALNGFNGLRPGPGRDSSCGYGAYAGICQRRVLIKLYCVFPGGLVSPFWYV